MLSSKTDSKSEARFVARIDVLCERVDTLAATVATTASAMAKRDGEIASLRKELLARDEKLQALALAAQGGGAASGELRELRHAIASLSSQRSKAGSSKQLDDLVGKVGLLGQRLETLSSTVATTAAGLSGREGELAMIRKRLESSAPSPVIGDETLLSQIESLVTKATVATAQLDEQAAELASLKAQIEHQDTEAGGPSDELRGMLATLLAQVEGLSELKSGVTEEQLNLRFVEADETLASLSKRMDALARNVDSATESLGNKEHELAALNRHFTESSARIESIVDDIREALSAFPEMGTATVDELATQVERVAADVSSLAGRVGQIETVEREAADSRERGTGEYASRIELIEQRVATVATEVARAKTLWPVALRSLEARLDDAVSHSRRPEVVAEKEETPVAEVPDETSDDLLASLRDSIQAMESVASEMARASDVLSVHDDDADVPDAAVAAAGATVVPLRATEP